MDNGVLRVTNGWYESGTLTEQEVDDPKNKDKKITVRKLAIDAVFAIGPGYPMVHFDITPKLIREGKVYEVKSFEPDVFGGSMPQDNTKHL